VRGSSYSCMRRRFLESSWSFEPWEKDLTTAMSPSWDDGVSDLGEHVMRFLAGCLQLSMTIAMSLRRCTRGILQDHLDSARTSLTARGDEHTFCTLDISPLPRPCYSPSYERPQQLGFNSVTKSPILTVPQKSIIG
jgi:hypothetical protein